MMYSYEWSQTWTAVNEELGRGCVLIWGTQALTCTCYSLHQNSRGVFHNIVRGGV